VKECPAGMEWTIILEAMADYKIWIWHAFFKMLGSCNDIFKVSHG
jgi:hypothetical protein